VRSIRFFATGTATADYKDSAWVFSDAPANPFTPTPFVGPGAETQVVNVGDQTSSPSSPMGTGRDPRDANPNFTIPSQPQPYPATWCSAMRIRNDGGGDLTFSFDGTNDHGVVKAGENFLYWNRFEAGICVKGAGVAFRIEAW
jgi:hypothetical protein